MFLYSSHSREIYNLTDRKCSELCSVTWNIIFVVAMSVCLSGVRVIYCLVLYFFICVFHRTVFFCIFVTFILYFILLYNVIRSYLFLSLCFSSVLLEWTLESCRTHVFMFCVHVGYLFIIWIYCRPFLTVVTWGSRHSRYGNEE